jgi:hypothetical protein
MINLPFAVSLLIALAIVYTSIGFHNVMISVLSVAILTILFYILSGSFMISNNGLSMESTTYPAPPHLGLDGVSVANRVAGDSSIASL